METRNQKIYGANKKAAIRWGLQKVVVLGRRTVKDVETWVDTFDGATVSVGTVTFKGKSVRVWSRGNHWSVISEEAWEANVPALRRKEN